MTRFVAVFINLATGSWMLDSSILSEATRAKSLELLHLNIGFIHQLFAAILALLLCAILLASACSWPSVSNRLIGGCRPTSVWLLLGRITFRHVNRLCVTWALGVLAILIVFHMDGIFFTLHALEIVPFPLKLIIFFFLWLILILRRGLLSVVAAAHVLVLTALNAARGHKLLLLGAGSVHARLVDLVLRGAVLRSLVLLLLHMPLFFSCCIILLAFDTNLLSITHIGKFAHASVTDVELLWIVVCRTFCLHRGIASLTYRIGILRSTCLITRWRCSTRVSMIILWPLPLWILPIIIGLLRTSTSRLRRLHHLLTLILIKVI